MQDMKWFLNLKTSVKLVTAFVLVAIMLAFVGFYGLANLGKMNDSLEDMYNIRLVPVNDTNEMQILYQRTRVHLHALHQTESVQEKNELLVHINGLLDELDALLTAYNRDFAQAEHAQLYNKALGAWQSYRTSVNDMIELSLQGRDAEFQAAMSGGFDVVRTELDNSLQALIAFNVASAEQAMQDGRALFAGVRSITIVIITTALVVNIGFGILISQIIARPLNRAVKLIGRVAEGDLRETVDVDRKDEFGQLADSINHMIMSLRNLTNGILASSENVAAASQQISASTEEIASGSTTQANDAQTLNELFRDLTKSIQSIAQSAEEASELANQTMNIAQEGGKVVHQSIEGMNLVNRHMSRLEEDSNKIGEIIKVIDDIADQTNLLALNAAIEAARAGDQGRGFAVVADEVRKLAERSGQATKEITAIIRGMQENTKQSVQAVENGVTSSHQTGEAFENIINMVRETASRVAEIAAASEEQSAQTSEVMVAVDSISATTEQAAASSEETAATAQSLAQLADDLNQAVSIFKTN